MSFTLSGGKPTVEVSASAAIVSQTATSATIRVTANSWMVYSGSSVQSSGVYANITINGTSSGAKRIFGDCYPDTVSGTSTHSITYDVTVTKGAAKSVSWSAAFHSYVDGTDLGVKDTKSGTVSVGAATYTISFDANGGSGAPENQTKNYDVDLTLSTTEPTRSGYTFQGWGTSATDTSVDYTAGGTYTANASDTLYAIWKKVITLTYNANGGSEAPAIQSGTVYNATTSYTFTVSPSAPTRTGYTFLGWSLTKGDTEASYVGKDTITLSSSDVLYAIWTPNMYKCFLYGQGGKIDGQTVVEYNAIYDSPVGGLNYGETFPVAVRTGYNFLGWNDQEDGSGTYYTGSEPMTVEGGMIFYAQWEPAASIVTLYLPNVNGAIEKRRGMMHMYNSDGNLCYAIMTIYDETGKGYLAN